MSLLHKIRSSTWIKINCALTLLITILLFTNYFQVERQTVIPELQPHEINQCCGFPCENGGVCISKHRSYTCDCVGTGYYGKNCEKVLIRQWINKLLTFNPTEAYTNIVNNFPSIQKILNSMAFFRIIFTRNLYMQTANWGNAEFRWPSAFDSLSSDSYSNSSFSARSLPPIPKMCPVAMGFRGPKHLPSTDTLFERLLKRGRFEACPKGTNVLFATYIQHFVSQFDCHEAQEHMPHEWGNNIIDMSHVYGKHESTIHALRSFKQGKLKCRYFKSEQYPPFLDDCPKVSMIYPQTHYKFFMSNMMTERQVNPRWALGNPSLSMTPMLFAMSTIWLREHNRVCTILEKEHKDWTDEQLYQTAKLIVMGEAIKITLAEIMQHFLQTRMEILYKPELASHLRLQYSGSIPKEFSILPHWHSLIPEQLVINSIPYNITKFTFTNNMVVFEHGLDQIIHAMATQPAGKISYKNIGQTFECCIKYLIDESRALRLQSYNNYRRRFGLKPAASFEELAGDLQTATILKELYLDVEAVELIVGLLVEHKGTGVAPPTMTAMTAAWMIRGLISHPINSHNIVKAASLKKLICLNMKNKCANVYIGFKIPNNLTKTLSDTF